LTLSEYNKATNFLGDKNEKMPAGKLPKDAAPDHTPDFFIDDSRLDVGVKAFANIVFDY
jgi:hypothetical protein